MSAPAAVEDVVLSVRGLKTYFEGEQGVAKAVDGVSFELHRGQIIGLVGESGSGKSVTGLSIMGLVDPPGRIIEGQVLFKGVDLTSLSPEDLRRLRGDRISIVFQDPMTTLNPVLTIGTQMTEAVRAHKENVGRSEARDIACDMLSRMGIANAAERLQNYPHQLSGGMRQRVAIATALINRPEFVIADEPTTALDVTIQSQIVLEVQQLCQKTGTSLIWITHDLALVAALADEICVMYAGRIVEHGPVEDVLSQPYHPYTRGLIGSIPSRNRRGQRLEQIRGTAPSLLSLPSGCSFHPRCPREDGASCRTVAPEVTDISGRHDVRCHYPLTDSDGD